MMLSRTEDDNNSLGLRLQQAMYVLNSCSYDIRGNTRVDAPASHLKDVLVPDEETRDGR